MANIYIEVFLLIIPCSFVDINIFEESVTSFFTCTLKIDEIYSSETFLTIYNAALFTSSFSVWLKMGYISNIWERQ
jgi:hypothetical protein